MGWLKKAASSWTGGVGDFLFGAPAQTGQTSQQANTFGLAPQSEITQWSQKYLQDALSKYSGGNSLTEQWQSGSMFNPLLSSLSTAQDQYNNPQNNPVAQQQFNAYRNMLSTDLQQNQLPALQTMGAKYGVTGSSGLGSATADVLKNYQNNLGSQWGNIMGQQQQLGQNTLLSGTNTLAQNAQQSWQAPLALALMLAGTGAPAVQTGGSSVGSGTATPAQSGLTQQAITGIVANMLGGNSGGGGGSALPLLAMFGL